MRPTAGEGQGVCKSDVAGHTAQEANFLPEPRELNVAYTVVYSGKLIDGTGAEPIEHGALVIEDNQIVAVASQETLDPPPGAAVIDVTDLTVMPGLIDLHHHLGGSFSDARKLRMTLERGVTTIGSVSGGPAGCRLRDAIARGDVRGCSRYLCAGVVVPTNGHVPGRNADGPWEVRKAVREMCHETVDYLKTAASGGFWGAHETCSVRNYTLEELVALVDEAHAWERPVAVHCHTQPGLSNCIEAGCDQIHHGAFIDRAAVEGIAEKGLFYVPTLRVTCRKNIDAWPDRPWMREEMEKSSPIHREGVRYAHELGVKLACGTDGPGSAQAWVAGDATPWELQELVGCGLTPLEAIRAATQTTAEAMGKGQLFGTLAPGKLADLVVVAGDPLQDVSVLYEQQNIALVMKDGVVESTDAAHQRYYTVRR